MPELPEVEGVLRTLCDGIPSLTGRVIQTVILLSNISISGDYGDVFQSKLEGFRFAGIRRHGKYLIFTLEGDGTGRDTLYLIVHLRMTGRLDLVEQKQAIERHTRLLLLLDGGLALRFDDPRKFGRVCLVHRPDQVTAALGPDALTVDAEEFAARLARHRRQIKPLLLDQTFVAGIGNIYADEILFRARIHPLTVSDTLVKRDVTRLHRALVEVLAEAVAAHGANIDGVFREGGFVVSVYGRTDKPCPLCGTEIAKIRVGQRGTHFCPACQLEKMKRKS